jgi:hypothetical protein
MSVLEHRRRSHLDATPSEARESGGSVLSPHAVRLRNTALGALSHRARRPAPTPTELEKLRADLDLRDAWTWWSGQDLPTQAVRAARRSTAVKCAPIWRATLLTLLASGAWLLAVRL